jgi:hypothetical protein
MGRGTSSFTPAERDAGLRRLRAFNRLLAAVAVAATALLTDVAAQAFPGHKRVVAAPPSSARAATPRAPARTARRRTRHRHAGHHRLQPPAQAPTSATTTQSQSVAPQPPAAQATGPHPAAPAPVVSGGS